MSSASYTGTLNAALMATEAAMATNGYPPASYINEALMATDAVMRAAYGHLFAPCINEALVAIEAVAWDACIAATTADAPMPNEEGARGDQSGMVGLNLLITPPHSAPPQNPPPLFQYATPSAVPATQPEPAQYWTAASAELNAPMLYGPFPTDCYMAPPGVVAAAADAGLLLHPNANEQICSDKMAPANPASSLPEPATPLRQRAFAKIEFPDGDFYMTTYAVDIGRHPGTFLQDESLTPQLDLAEHLVPTMEQMQHTAANDDGFVHSTLSESGEINHAGAQRVTFTAPNHESTGQSDPSAVPLVPILPPPLFCIGQSCYKSISKRHLRIYYSFDNEVFEMKTLGRNGVFLNEIHYPPTSDAVELHDGDRIQIGTFSLVFRLPTARVEHDHVNVRHSSSQSASAGADLNPDDQRGTDIVHDDEDADHGEAQQCDTPSEARPTLRKRSRTEPSSRRPRKKARIETTVDQHRKRKSTPRVLITPTENVPQPSTEMAEPAVNSGSSGRRQFKARSKGTTVIHVLTAEEARKCNLEPGTIIERVLGPGRPPKNGIMSKRESTEIMRSLEERGEDPEDGPKTTLKFTLIPPRQQRDAEETAQTIVQNDPGDVSSTGNGEGQVVEKQKKQKKPNKVSRPARSPSPVMHMSDYTEEQLQRPAKTCLDILYEVLSDAPGKTLPMHRIYRAVKTRYPYFAFTMAGTGWRSTIRHNLGHQAFRKGSGSTYSIVPDVPIQKAKRKRVATPPQNTQAPSHPQNTLAPSHPQNTLAPSHPQSTLAPSHPQSTPAPPHQPLNQHQGPPIHGNLPAAIPAHLQANPIQQQRPYRSPYGPNAGQQVLPAVQRPSSYAALAHQPIPNSCV